MKKCVICHKRAKYKCRHFLYHTIRYYCDVHKPELDEPCEDYIGFLKAMLNRIRHKESYNNLCVFDDKGVFREIKQ